MNNQPIGVLDSGVGGLSVWREIAALLPQESTLYLGDSLNTPYGEKNPNEITELTQRMIKFLIEKHVKLIVVACNTITLNSIEALRLDFPDMPLIGTVPVIKGAATITKNKKIGLLATTAGAESLYIKHLTQEFASGCSVTTVGTDEIVPLIEKGEVESNEMQKILKKELAAFQKDGIDTLVLGSTHFPFIKPRIQAILGDAVTVLDSGPAIARQVKRVLENNSALTEEENSKHIFYTTGDSAVFAKTAQTLLGEALEVEETVL
ncbi:MAG TPA: glutamate racemase [Candidatus Saccharimonadales bacterium]|nr:glutamate racemase [Candidatus Saccharimonadales bacterium]